MAHSPDGRRTAHARQWGGPSNGRGAREGGRRESASQGEAGGAGARRRRGPEAPRRARRARSPDRRSPGDRGARGAGGPGCAPKAGGWGEAGKGSLRRSRRRQSPASAGNGPPGGGGAVTSGRGRVERRDAIRQPCRPTPRAPPAPRPAPTPRPPARVPARSRGGPTHSLSSSPPPPPPLGAAAAAAAIFRTAFTTALSPRGGSARAADAETPHGRRRAPPSRPACAQLHLRACAPPPVPERAGAPLDAAVGVGRGLGGDAPNWRDSVSVPAREKGADAPSSCRLAANGRHLGKRGGLGAEGMV